MSTFHRCVKGTGRLWLILQALVESRGCGDTFSGWPSWCSSPWVRLFICTAWNSSKNDQWQQNLCDSMAMELHYHKVEAINHMFSVHSSTTNAWLALSMVQAIMKWLLTIKLSNFLWPWRFIDWRYLGCRCSPVLSRLCKCALQRNWSFLQATALAEFAPALLCSMCCWSTMHLRDW